LEKHYKIENKNGFLPFIIIKNFLLPTKPKIDFFAQNFLQFGRQASHQSGA